MKKWYSLLAFAASVYMAPAHLLAQQGLSRVAAQDTAAAALRQAIAIHKMVAAKEWGTGNNMVKSGGYTMRFNYKIFGNKPADGRSLYISLHGGGGAPTEVNDQQWKNQHNLYTPKEGIYLVPRAPTDTWNLWHENHVDDMLEEIIKDAIVMDDVNPNKVYIMGYSAGGDGVFQLAPRMADHWAAAAMMAGHPGDANALNLRNLPFGIYMGGADAAYNRNGLAKLWGQLLDSLQQTDTAAFIHDTHIYPGLPHWMNRNDTIALDWMKKFTRNPLPPKIIWVQDDRHRNQFYWLGTNLATVKTGDKAIVSVSANTITVEENNLETLFIYLNDSLLDLDEPVTVLLAGKKIFKGRLERKAAIIQQSASGLQADFIFSVQLEIKEGKVVR